MPTDLHTRLALALVLPLTACGAGTSGSDLVGGENGVLTDGGVAGAANAGGRGGSSRGEGSAGTASQDDTGTAGQGSIGMSGQGGVIAEGGDAGPAIHCEGAAPDLVLDPKFFPPPGPSNAGPAATISVGQFDQTHSDDTSPSAMGNVSQLNGLWEARQPGAFLEYTVSAPRDGSYSFAPMFNAKDAGATAIAFVDGVRTVDLYFGSKAELGEYSAVPQCCSRGQAISAHLTMGNHQIRLVFTNSVPIGIYGLQLNDTGLPLSAPTGKVHPLSESGATTITHQEVSDNFRMSFDPMKDGWPCEKVFCLIEYLLEAPAAGGYDVQFSHATKACHGARFLVNDKEQTTIKLDPATTSATVKVQLPCGKSRLSIRNPNAINGQFCGDGSTYKGIVVTPAKN